MKTKKADQLFKKLEKKFTKSVAEKKKREEQKIKEDKELIEAITGLKKMIIELVRPEMKELLKPFIKTGFKIEIKKFDDSKKVTIDTIVGESYTIRHPANPEMVLCIWIETFDYIPQFAFGYNLDNESADFITSKRKEYTLQEFDAGIIQKVFKKGIKKFLKNS
jgi:hypothetical protein